MGAKYLLKYFALSFLAQVGLLFACRVVPGLRELLLYIYEPWILLAVNSSTAKGEGSMIWPPFFGLVGGVLIYSLAAAIVIYCFKGRRRMP